MKELIIGLGSNLGNRLENLSEAVRRLSQCFGEPARVSSFIETEPRGFESENRFLNGVVVFWVEEVGKVEGVRHAAPIESCGQELLRMLECLQSIEGEMGRVRTGGGYTDRTIDLDILFIGDLIIDTPELTIPHPHLHERDFVLIPLAEVCPGWVHPGLGRTVEEMVRDSPR